MYRRRGLAAALAAVAATAGAGYASGRELTVFFAQTGRVSWLGIPLASAVFGLLLALLCHCGERADADSFALLSRRLLPPRAGTAAAWLHGIMLTVAAAAMLLEAGEVGALTLPVAHGFLWGAGLALLLALGVCLFRLRPLPWIGFAALLAGVSFYGALAMDPAPVRPRMEGGVQLALEGSLPAALLLALACAAMNASLAAGAVLSHRRGARPARVGALCAAMMWAMLTCGCAALARGGRALLGQALPSVVLSARWGLAGFWMCAAFGFLCATATLSSAMAGLIDHLRCRKRKLR